MINRAHRFHGYSSLRFVYRHGQTVRGPMVALRFAVNDRQDNWRVAVVVSRKVSKSAVVRNRIRRRVYEVMRANKDHIKAKHDMVIMVFSPQLTDLDSAKMDQIILELLDKAGITASTTPPERAIVNSKEK